MKPSVVIVGGGITGLAAAWELQQHGVDYVLLEGSERLGGKIVTERADGFIIDGGADSFLTSKPWAWQLCQEAGLSDQLVGTNEAQRQVYVLRGGKLHPMPRGMRLIVPLDPEGLLQSDLLSEQGKQRMLAEPTIPVRTETSDESLASFVERRFGVEALEVFGESLLAGIHTADPRKLSMQSSFPNYVTYEHEFGSVIRGMQHHIQNAAPIVPDSVAPKTMFVSFKTGMYGLIEGLQTRLTGDLQLGQAVTRIDPDRTIHTSRSEPFRPDAVIITTPTHAAHKILHDAAPQLAHVLSMINTVSSGTVSLGYRADQLPGPLDGTGFVIPHREPTRLLACTWSSTKLPGRAPEGYVLLRVFVGGHGREDDVMLPDDQLVALARAELRQVMHIEAEPVISRVFRWRNANPQYEVEHLDRVAQLKLVGLPWLVLAGCSYDGVGIPDCVRQGRDAAKAIVSQLERKHTH